MSIIGIVPKTKMTKKTKMTRLARKLAINLNIPSVYPFFNEIEKFFLFFFKGGYNSYNTHPLYEGMRVGSRQIPCPTTQTSEKVYLSYTLE